MELRGKRLAATGPRFRNPSFDGNRAKRPSPPLCWLAADPVH
eukprot:CAMPEP_0174844512 /NCGR_PEP_ID=MMETSP1114-20130205/11142_1 /TAXON_ID=312471 /ORGANISM="Neobodo designis, Strain CCAP 1951/1" /LENGTH=41 /DNA_ID= /DNA_START= /DNA_END= /DNA_ORIENTATION=